MSELDTEIPAVVVNAGLASAEAAVTPAPEDPEDEDKD